jgi:hypothetical protein
MLVYEATIRAAECTIPHPYWHYMIIGLIMQVTWSRKGFKAAELRLRLFLQHMVVASAVTDHTSPNPDYVQVIKQTTDFAARLASAAMKPHDQKKLNHLHAAHSAFMRITANLLRAATRKLDPAYGEGADIVIKAGEDAQRACKVLFAHVHGVDI